MSHVLATAAEIIGAVALVATGVGAAGSAGILTLSVAAAKTVATVALIASLASTAAGIGAQALAKKPPTVTNPMDWQANPLAGIPYVMGQAYSGGQIVYWEDYGSNNSIETIITVYSAGPVKSFDQLYVDGVATSVDGITANIYDRGKMLISTQFGAQPELKQLGDLGPPNLTAASKMSGLAASSATFIYDTKGGHTFETEPQVGYLITGPTIYDPRKDSTYPGGNGPQRSNDETTWSFVGNDNPCLHGLTWLIGRRQNGILMMGAGVPIETIIVDSFVEGANVCDANGWKIGGVVTSIDDKWDKFTEILQAGGCEPIFLGAQVACLINTPRVSLATINEGDVAGDASVQATQPMRSRINSIVPRYMAEQAVTVENTSEKANSDGSYPLTTTVTWGMFPGDPIVVEDYVTFDGGERQKQVDYPFVQCRVGAAPIQAAQLARYDLENAREFGPITLPLKLRWMGYKPGDVVTANLPTRGLVNQDILLLNRTLSPQNATVTMTARSETKAKHAFALGQTGTPPPTPTLSGAPLIPIPGASAWVLAGGTIASDNGTTIPCLQITGSADSSVIDAVVFQYRLSQTSTADAGPWQDAGSQAPTIELLDILGVKDETSYDVAIAYRKGPGTGTPLILGPAVAGQTAVPYQTGVIGPKPPVDADNTATVFAAAGLTPQQVVESISVDVQSFLSLSLRQDQQLELFNAMSYVAGQGVNAYVLNFQNEQLGVNSALESAVSLIGTKNSAGTAYVLNGATALAGSTGTLAQQLSDLEATNGTVTAKVATLEEAFLNTDGTAKSFYTLEVSVVGPNGTKVMTGFTNTANSDGSTSFAILAGDFQIVDPSNGTPTTVFSITGGIVRMHSVEVDTLAAKSVTTETIAGGAVSNLTAYAFPDVQVGNSETTIAEIDSFQIGDATDGKAIAFISFTQDGTSNVDTGMTVKAYVRNGAGGWVQVRSQLQGVRVSGGNASWVLPVAFTVPMTFNGVGSLKITGQSANIGGGGNLDSSYARNIAVDIFNASR